jgi:hypothetical protein
MIRRLMNVELEGIWKEAIVAESRNDPGICLEGSRETTKNFSQHSHCPVLDSKRVPPGEKTGLLPLHQPTGYGGYEESRLVC